ncbi:hypothetical protein [Phaeovulum sp. NW3]|uniref:hypothetical protein n=1 Tax=Phaeovulum sp. NW3 TaxID=2934933 RepID=UPI0020202907|nr:hypothetical protein [Phaeovulum sp. NW3]MCL7465044.1 hypothetical protein [Phaeovulum sp. NW3]
MDRISGLMPQIGWSPLLAVAAPKKAPSTTVEAAGGADGARARLGADVGGQTGQPRGFAGARDQGQGDADAGLYGGEPPPDPDAPTGPPPAFDMTWLEAQAARRRAGLPDPPPRDGGEKDAGQPEALQLAPGQPDPVQSGLGPAALSVPRDDPTPPRDEAAPRPAKAEGWPVLAPDPAPRLDVTR